MSRMVPRRETPQRLQQLRRTLRRAARKMLRLPTLQSDSMGSGRSNMWPSKSDLGRGRRGRKLSLKRRIIY